MNKGEINKLAQVIHNKIYNENIRLCEQLAYEGQKYYDKVLFEKEVSIADIEMAITCSEDLNQMNGLARTQYLNIDLNAFLSRVIAIREYTMQSYGKVMANNPLDLIVFWLEPIMECFTEKEKMYLKKTFLKRITNFENIYFMDDDFVDDLFFVHFNELKKIIETENDQKLMLLK